MKFYLFFYHSVGNDKFLESQNVRKSIAYEVSSIMRFAWGYETIRSVSLNLKNEKRGKAEGWGSNLLLINPIVYSFFRMCVYSSHDITSILSQSLCTCGVWTCYLYKQIAIIIWGNLFYFIEHCEFTQTQILIIIIKTQFFFILCGFISVVLERQLLYMAREN